MITVSLVHQNNKDYAVILTQGYAEIELAVDPDKNAAILKGKANLLNMEAALNDLVVEEEV